MLKLDGQICLQFNLGPLTDIFGVSDFYSMYAYEFAGGLRPIIEMTFNVQTEEVVQYLNEGNLITLMYGIDEPTTEIATYCIGGSSKDVKYSVGSTVSILASWYNPKFTNIIRGFNYGKCRSFEVLKQIADNNNLRFITNVTKTNDKQAWVQSGLTDWQYMNKVAMSAYRNLDTFFCYGFDCNSLYFYDVRELLKEGPKWYLTVNKAGTNQHANVVNIGQYEVTGEYSGTMNDLVGRGLQIEGYNLDTGELFSCESKLKSFTTVDTDKLNIMQDDCKKYDYRITTEDFHLNNLTANAQNYRNNILFSSYICNVPVPAQYRNFKLFDVVQLIPFQKDIEASGIYIITGIVKQYQDHHFQINLTLNRESPNGVKGDTLTVGVE